MANADRAHEETAQGPVTEEGGGGEGAALRLVELMLEEHAAQQPAPILPERIDGVLIGQILAVDAADTARVTFPESPTEGLAARAMISLAPADVGRAVALMFEGGDPLRPIVMGRMAAQGRPSPPPPPLVAEADGRRIEVSAEEQLVLRCGEASITLTRSGKIILRGAYVLSRSSGVNRIQGGSVEIN
jgi:hypothetical protein